jgi:hypothetical protein
MLRDDISKRSSEALIDFSPTLLATDMDNKRISTGHFTGGAVWITRMYYLTRGASWVWMFKLGWRISTDR